MLDTEGMFGYKQITTFFDDFTIADRYGEEAIKDTYKSGLEYAKTDYKVLTEFVMVLNWKLWEHYEKGNEKYARVYDKLWRSADTYAIKTLKGEKLQYFYETTD